MIWFWCIVVSLSSAAVMLLDVVLARWLRIGLRVPEALIALLAIGGGGPGVLIVALLTRHKTRHAGLMALAVLGTLLVPVLAFWIGRG